VPARCYLTFLPIPGEINTMTSTAIRPDLARDPYALEKIMEFDHIIRVHADGTVSDGPADAHAPELYWGGEGFGENLSGDYRGTPWHLLNGYSGQYGYRGPIMHDAEFIGGGMARAILEAPGLYVALTCDVLDCDDCADAEDSSDADCGGDHEPAGWAVAYIAD
jgi:hypothetical protein